VTYLLRVPGSGPDIGAAARRALTRVNPQAVVVEVTSLAERLHGSIKSRTFAMAMLTFFAIAGLGVCAAGLVGVVTFVVARRTREIAIHVALGATPSKVLRFVLRDATTAAAAGVVGGALVGGWLSTGLERLLFGVRPGDWATTGAAAVVMLVVVMAASLWPAARALRLSPTAALRVE
jgi:putative ABC transport system permease protein